MIRTVALAALVVSLPVHAADFTAKPRHVGDGDTESISLRAKGIDALRAEYLAAEAEAKDAMRGLWSGKFIAPATWRRGERLACER